MRVTLARLFWDDDRGYPFGHWVGLDRRTLCDLEVPQAALGAGPVAYCKRCIDAVSAIHRHGDELEFIEGDELLSLLSAPRPYARSRASALAERTGQLGLALELGRL